MEHENDYFREYFDARFDNLENRISELNDVAKKTHIQTTLTNGRVSELEKWRHTSQGQWNGVTKTITIIASGVGAVLGILAVYYVCPFFTHQIRNGRRSDYEQLHSNKLNRVNDSVYDVCKRYKWI